MPAHGVCSKSELVMPKHLLGLTVPVCVTLTVAYGVQGRQRSYPAGSAMWSAMSPSCGSTKWTLKTCCPALNEILIPSSEGAACAMCACHQKQVQQAHR